MPTEYNDEERDWAAYGAAREVKPERQLLQAARNGDELAAQELLLWPKFYQRDMIDPEVYEAIVSGALDVAAFVANECKSPKPGKKENIAKVKASMFFNGGRRIRSQDRGKEIDAKSARIGLAVANGPGDSELLSASELRVALTQQFAPMVVGQTDGYPKARRVKSIREAEQRLVQFIRWKYSPHVTADDRIRGVGRSAPLDIDEDICKALIAVSFPEIRWNRDANEPYPYPPEWDTANSPGHSSEHMGS